MQTVRSGFKRLTTGVEGSRALWAAGVHPGGRDLHSSASTALPNKTVADAQPNRHQDIYDDAYRRSIKRPDDFWAAAAEQLTWHKKWDKVLDDSNSPFTKWYVVDGNCPFF